MPPFDSDSDSMDTTTVLLFTYPDGDGEDGEDGGFQIGVGAAIPHRSPFPPTYVCASPSGKVPPGLGPDRNGNGTEDGVVVVVVAMAFDHPVNSPRDLFVSLYHFVWVVRNTSCLSVPLSKHMLELYWRCKGKKHVAGVMFDEEVSNKEV